MTIPIKIILKKDLGKETNQEEIWDSIARPWKTYVVKKIPIVEEFLKNKKGVVVDLGCGTGRNMIPNSDIEYYGVDFSKEQLKHAEKHIKKEKIKAKLIKSKADKLDKDVFENEMFDYGLFIATLHCLETSKERKDALKEFHRVLKSDSEALISVWDAEDKRFDCVGNKGDIYMSWRENNISYMRYYYLYKKEELLGLLEKTGFEVLGVYGPQEKDRFSKKNLIVRVKKV